ncbi:MAG: helicase-related protein [Thermaurantiacus sp.]|nr:helicase-related protein [Thermaurantiacus sp.]
MTAVLGPTNTGKTHLAVERMCAHAGGVMGFPLRLLAREVYDRVVAIKGQAQVALVTGEERIVPPGARYLLCTAESLPTDRAFPFVALDEAQLGADPERGHVFTNALLHVRGTAETMILGSETLAPLVRRLLPDAEIQSRPRFSRLEWQPPRKLSRLPSRTAIVAFSTEQVYAVAEMLRRLKGGAAVVTGALSPRTRNAQVALFQAGEVDHLVATDAIGMGLNMDIAHVAFASLSKFDGRRHRRLTVAEIAQIAGRAGRHQRDGTFGTVILGSADDAPTLAPAEIEAIEQHRFPPLTSLYWRNARLDFSSLRRLVMSLDALPSAPELVRGQDAIDVAVLKRLAGEPWVMERARHREAVMRLWAVCGLPDYRQTGPERHARLVGRIFRYLTEGHGRLPEAWIASELAVLDNLAGDIDTLSDRIAAARTWSFVAHRADWLDDAAGWAERARALEDKLSDALHQRLTQRFVDRRTAVLRRDLRHRQDPAVEVDPDGTVVVDGAIIGTLDGFAFRPDPTARAGEKRLMLAAAERRLARELAARAQALVASAEADFTLDFDGRMPPRIRWRGAPVAVLRRGGTPLAPRIELERHLDAVGPALRAAVAERLDAWLRCAIARELGPLARLPTLAQGLGPQARGLVVQLVEAMGSLPRASVEALLEATDPADRRRLRAAGVRFGIVHLFLPAVLKPRPTRWRLALWAVQARMDALPPPPPAGRVAVAVAPDAPPGFYAIAGFWPVGRLAVRIDLVDRTARALHAQRRSERVGDQPFTPDPQLRHALGLDEADFARLLKALGFQPRTDGLRFVRPRAPRPAPPAYTPFARLHDLMGG